MHLGAANSHFQHIISDTRPTIRHDPSSASGSAKPRRTLDPNDTVPVQKHIYESIKQIQPLFILKTHESTRTYGS